MRNILKKGIFSNAPSKIKLIGFGLLATSFVLLQDSSEGLAAGTSVTEMNTKEYSIYITDSTQSAVFPRGVSLNGESLEGKTFEEGQAMIQEYIRSMQDRAVNFTVFGSQVFNYNGEMLGVTWQNPQIEEEMQKTLPSSNFVEQYLNQKDYEANPVNFTVELACDADIITQQVETISSYYTTGPSEPSIALVDGQMQVTPGVVGITFDTAAVAAQCIALVNDYSSTELVSYDFPYTETQPSLAADVYSFTWSILGEYTTDNLGGGNREHNIALSAQHLNGTILFPGQQAAVMQNNLYGDVSEAGGYLSAPVYNQGKQEDDISGGICQTTTTLYNALLRAEMGIVYRSKHSMLVTYVPPSLDAMVNTSGGDFIFSNTSNYPIYVEAYVWNGVLGVRIWGMEERPANRSVDYVSETLEVRWEEQLYNEHVDDSIATFGLAEINEKVVALVETHPYVRSRSYKVVYEDGVEVARTVLTEDSYRSMRGELYRASDCLVSNNVIATDGTGAYRFLGNGYDIYHRITFLNGETWNAADPDNNYGN